MKHNRSIQHTEWPIGYIQAPIKGQPDYNKKMKSLTNRFNNWAKYIKKQNENQL